MRHALLGLVLFPTACCSHAFVTSGFASTVTDLSTATSRDEGHVFASAKSFTRPGKNEGFIAGLIAGFILWCFVPICLWNNERIAIKQYKLQLKAERWAVHIDDPDQAPIKEMEGHIAYVTGTSMCSARLEDSVFRMVQSLGSIKLRRVVQMKQWIEYENKDKNDRTYYTYKQDWVDTYEEVHHDRSKRNPPMPITSTKREKENYRWWTSTNGEPCKEASHREVRLGAYYLGEYVTRELNNWKDVKIDPAQLTNPTGVMTRADALQGAPQPMGGWWYFGGRTGEIGDVRIKFEELLPGPLSVCGILTRTQIGWTFVPLIRTTNQGVGEGVAAEAGTGCCVRVKELHYDAEDKHTIEEFKQDLQKRPSELTKQERKAFHRAQTTAAVTEYETDDMDDLCCVGPCGGLVTKLLHWIGLEEEYLGVQEQRLPIDQLAAKENHNASHRHCMARVAGLGLLMLGSWLIIRPAVYFLNVHWLISLFGGAIISLFLIIAMVLCSCAAWMTIVSVAWMAHRPLLSALGLLVAAACVGFFWFCAAEEQQNVAATVNVGKVSFAGKVAFLELQRVSWGH